MNRLMPFLLMLALAAAPACGNDDDDDDTANDDDTQANDDDTDSGPPPTYLIDPEPPTTLTRTLRPLPLPATTLEAIEAETMNPEEMERYGDMGIGEYETAPGESHRLIDDLAPEGWTAPAGLRRSLAYFLHLSDNHITDAESPLRLEGYTKLLSLGSTFRPQSIYTTQMLDATVQTANALAGEDGYDFAVITGDMVDSGQQNEMRWFLDVMDGNVVNPDSGEDHSPVDGPGNDAFDPFQAVGLDAPWLLALGNHEQQLIGTFTLLPEHREQVVGSEIIDPVGLGVPGAGAAVRDDRTPYGDLRFEGPVPPDDHRAFVEIDDIAEMVLASATPPPGHGFGDALRENQLDYVYDLPGVPVRLIVFDTLVDAEYGEDGQPHYDGTDAGYMTRAQFDQFLQPALDQALADGVLVLLACHHPATRGFSGISEVSSDELRALFTGYPNVLAHLVGHNHQNDVNIVPPPEGMGSEYGYVEVMAAATIDWPNQFRIGELVDNGDGTISLFSTVVDFSAAPGTLAETARRFSIAREQFIGDDLAAVFDEKASVRNVEVVLTLPPAWAGLLDGLALSERVHSLTTLAGAR